MSGRLGKEFYTRQTYRAAAINSVERGTHSSQVRKDKRDSKP